MLGLLRQRNFASVWIAALISTIGDWVLLIGLPIYIYLLTRSVLATGLMMVAGGIPRILLGPVAGVLADRWNPKRTLVIGNLLLATIVLLLLLVRTPAMVWVVYVQSALIAIVQQFLAPSGAALLPTLVKDEQLVRANAALALSGNLGRLVGPVIGGVVATRFGLAGMVLIDSASFFISALLISFVVAQRRTLAQALPAAPDVPNAPEVGALARGWREWIAGLGVIRREPSLRTLVIALGVSSLGEGVFGPLFPVFVVQILHGGAGQIGSLMTLQAVGGMVGGLLIGRIGSRAIRRGVFGCATLLHGCVCAAFFNAPRLHTSLALELGLFALSGATGISALTGFAGLTQLRSPDRFRGRVSSALSFAGSIFGLVGVIIALAAVNRFGVLAVVTLQGVGYVCGGIVILTMLPPPSPRR